MPKFAHSFAPADGIIVATGGNLASVIPFPIQQALGGAAKVAQLIKNDPTPAEDFRFTLFSAEFLNLQSTIEKVLKLPISEGDFEQKYGTFGQKQTVLDVVQALKNLRVHCGKFGTPSTLYSHIKELGEGQRPTVLYARLVWLAQRITVTAESFQFTLESLLEFLEKLTTAERRYRALQSLLGGESGLITKAEEMAKESQSLRDAVRDYREEMRVIKAPIDKYFSSSSKIYDEAKQQRDDLAQLLATTQAALDAANKSYNDYCIAAGASAGGLMVLSMGMAWPLAAVAGGVLGALAEEARKRAEALEAEKKRLKVLEGPKIALLSDITGLQTSMTPLETQLTKVYDGLGAIHGIWSNVAVEYNEILKTTTPEKLKNLDEFSITDAILAGQKRWKKTAEVTEQFTARAFIDFKG